MIIKAIEIFVEYQNIKKAYGAGKHWGARVHRAHDQSVLVKIMVIFLAVQDSSISDIVGPLVGAN